MNTPSKALAIAAAVILAAGTAHASPTGGAGALPCSRIVAQAQKSPSDTQFAIVQWGLGFMTALNTTQNAARQLDNDDIGQRIWSAVAGYCRGNPDKSAAIAVIGFWKSLPEE